MLTRNSLSLLFPSKFNSFFWGYLSYPFLECCYQWYLLTMSSFSSESRQLIIIHNIWYVLWLLPGCVASRWDGEFLEWRKLALPFLYIHHRTLRGWAHRSPQPNAEMKRVVSSWKFWHHRKPIKRAGRGHFFPQYIVKFLSEIEGRSTFFSSSFHIVASLPSPFMKIHRPLTWMDSLRLCYLMFPFEPWGHC